MKTIFQGRGVLGIMMMVVLLMGILSACNSGRHCAGVSSTGNYKPHVRKKEEKGLMSAKMQRQMNKKVKAGPLEGKKLQFPQ